ncbi:MAG: VWA domain-containing protein [Polyangiaceae bacterium]|nr:VWA domain-containing protein [Polyangiaceae bacterium]
MRRSWTFGLLAMLGLGLAFTYSCKKNDDDDDAYSGTGGTQLADDDDDKATGGKGQADDDDDTSKTDDDDDTPTEPEPCKELVGLTDKTCFDGTKPSKAIPVNMLLVIDKSGSMMSEDTYDQPKWQALTSALTDALTADTMIKNPNMSVGLLLFPGEQVTEDSAPEDSCDLPKETVNVEIGPASDTVDSIIETLEDIRPGGSTPTADALNAALTYFEGGEGSLLKGDKYVLLATDGGPNCNDALDCDNDECTIALDGLCTSSDCCANDPLWCVDWKETKNKIAALKKAGVKTIVVGIPGSEAYTGWLNDFADAGGAVAPTATDDDGAHYYEVSASGGIDALTKTFEDITVSLVRSCRIQLDYTPASTSEWLVNVALDCKVVPQGGEELDGAAGAGGDVNWEIDRSTDPPTIELLGDYCEKVQRGVERIDIIIGCPPLV